MFNGLDARADYRLIHKYNEIHTYILIHTIRVVIQTLSKNHFFEFKVPRNGCFHEKLKIDFLYVKNKQDYTYAIR